ncbi:DUF359 domain-containing protein [Halobacteriales archaeon QS_7_69_60]|nr:MAG: DUF359 domain-containing protein [Halobacteriales archaeon QS_7_69_60]
MAGADPEVVAELPDALRGELKEPLGPVYTDAETLLADADGPLVAVGDIVTYHLLEADARPDAALVDGRTERERVDREVREAVAGFDDRLEAVNPAATLSTALLEALGEAVRRPGSVVVAVDGEEDLAALPAVLVAPDGAAVVYGQPGEGMVLAAVDDARRERCRELLAAMDGDYDRLTAVLGI